MIRKNTNGGRAILSITQNKKSIRNMNGKLNEILETAEAQHPFGRINFVAMEKLVFLWIIGNNGAQMEELLIREKKKIVDDDRAVCIICSEAGKISETQVYQQFLQGIECASRNYLNVDLYQIMVCPVFLPGCLETDDHLENLKQAAVYLQQEMAKRQRYLEWSPFLLLENEKINISRLQTNFVITFMDYIMEEGRRNHQNCCCPCCIISDVNEKGMEISDEQKAKTLLMLTVFRNTACENMHSLNTVLYPIAEESKEYFFTARAISVCEPVKSLVLNRLLAVHRCFFCGRYEQSKIFDEWQHKFFESNVWKEHLDRVAHDEKYQILTMPIYSNIPVADSRVFVERLKKFCEKYYFRPLAENEGEMLEAWWKAFWSEYFLGKAGSVENLENLEEYTETILSRVPEIPVRTAGGTLLNDLRGNCEEWAAKELRNHGKYLVEKGLRSDGRYMSHFRKKRAEVMEVLQEMEVVMKNQERRLCQTELLLNTGGGHIANPQQEAESWLMDYASTEVKKWMEVYRLYQEIMCQVFQNAEEILEHLTYILLDIYYKVVAGSIESREGYMKTKLTDLAGSDMAQLIGKLGENWLYPVRLIGSENKNVCQKLFVMGSKDNLLCRKMLEQANYQVAFKENTLDDRLEIIRISDRFSKQRLFTEE